MKRFYREVGVAAAADGGYAVTLDGKPIRTPGKRLLVAPTRALAEAIADEWRGQSDIVRPAAMPTCRLANSACDHVASRRAAVIDEIARFADTDLVCYRAERPDDLVALQHDQWHPLVEWCAEAFGAALTVTSGLVPTEQPAAALDGLRAAVAAFAIFPLAALHQASAACNSVVIGLALAHGRIDGETAWRLSLLDETFQIGRWGEDDEATDRRDRLKADIITASGFLALCGQK